MSWSFKACGTKAAVITRLNEHKVPADAMPQFDKVRSLLKSEVEQMPDGKISADDYYAPNGTRGVLCEASGHAGPPGSDRSALFKVEPFAISLGE